MPYKYLFLILSLSPLIALAEDDSMNRNVTVERDYNPVTIDAKKISPVPTKEELNPEKPEVTYSTWSSAEQVEIKNGDAKADRFSGDVENESKKGVAKLGLGFYWQTLAELYYPLLSGDDYLFELNLKHKGNFSHNTLNDGTTPRAMEHNSSLMLGFGKQFRTLRLSTGANVSYNGFDFYGMVGGADKSLQQRYGDYTTAGFDLGLTSTNPYSDVKYDIGIGYNYFGRNGGIAEHVIEAEAEIAGEVGSGELGAEIEICGDIMTHNNPAEKSTHGGCFIKLTPFYAFGGKEWNLKIGANLFIMGEKGAKRPVTGSAAIEGTFGLVPELLYLNAGIGGDFNENHYSHIMKENKWVNPDLCVEPTYTPVDVNLGLKANLMKGLLFEAGVRYAYILDQYFFVNDTLKDGTYTNTFHAVYDEKGVNKVTAQLGLHFTYVKGLNIKLIGKYNFWGVTSVEKAWQRPAWEVNFDARYTFLEKWCVGLSYNFLGGRYALINGTAEKMKNVNDLNLYFSYKPLDWLEVYATGNNLINIKADSYYGYTCMGINGTIGAVFRF